MNPFTQRVVDVAHVSIVSEGTPIKVGFAAGFLVKPCERLRFGLSYHSHMDVDLEGPATFGQISTGNAQFDAAVAQSLPFDKKVQARTTLQFPSVTMFGVAYDVTPNLTLEADGNYTTWRVFDQTVLQIDTLPDSVLPHGWEDTWTVRAGLTYRIGSSWIGGGFVYDQTPQPDADAGPFLPDANRTGGTIGAGIASREALRVPVLEPLPLVPRADDHDEQGQLQRHVPDVRDPAERHHQDDVLREHKTTMKIPKSLLRISLALAAVAALSSASTARAQVDLTRMAWVGDSEGAGYSAGCLTKRVQVDSPGAILARTNGVDYQQPIINDPGQGGCLILTSLAPSFGKEPSTGTPANLALPRPYNNLSVGGCAIHDMLTATTGAQTVGAGTCRNTIDLVLRNSVLHLGSMVDQAIALNPTFVVLENVGNDYLGAVAERHLHRRRDDHSGRVVRGRHQCGAREAQGEAAEVESCSASRTSRASRSRRRFRRSSRAAASSS